MVSHYGWTLPIQASSFAKEVDRGLYIIHGAMFLIFILWAIFFTYLLIRYRRREGAEAQHPKHENVLWSLAPDIAILAFEIGLIALYAVPTWSRMKIRPPSPENSNVLNVVAEQFNWIAHYPGPDGQFGRRKPELVDFANILGLDPQDPNGKDDVVSVNEIHLPLGKTTLIRLSSKDVIHSFSIAEFRIKQDAVPGLEIPLWFEPTLAGTFELTCAQLCGIGHAAMRATVHVEDKETFEDWISTHGLKQG
jgi:cytochrome c oxidase subunit 2